MFCSLDWHHQWRMNLWNQAWLCPWLPYCILKSPVMTPPSFFCKEFLPFVWTFFFSFNFPVVCVQKEQTINFELVILDVNLLLVGKKDVLNYFCFFFVPRYIMVCPLWRYVHACLLRLPIEGVNIRSFWGFHFHPPAVGVCVRVQFLLDAITSQSVFFLLDVNIL